MNLQPYYPDHYESANAPHTLTSYPWCHRRFKSRWLAPHRNHLTRFPASAAWSHKPSILEKIQLLPPPPLSKAPLRPDSSAVFPGRRTKRKSKFTKEQDQLIVSLKRQGRSWVEIADIANVGSYLTARNRYQVIVGQQGSAHLCPWSQDNKMYLQRLLDGAELAKWDFIAKELSKQTGKHFTSKECREYARFLLFSSPESMG
ncbi:hypothetical_protein [Candidozyma auris]|uniref:hypothetical_protein n=1 Tax=Candidozyma auris TaxID=498019 RepID=UPI001256EF42|nr:hypothetical_protein [[Candida] auris]QEO23424.1 hypothetical_protein [[Candida] auris]